MNVVLDSGTYNYTVTAAGYHPQSGTFSVAGSKVSKNITLSADSATVTLTAPDNAEIWVNGVKRSTSSWSGTLNSGTYIFEARKAGHKSATLSKHITSAEPRQSYTLPAPTPIVGSLIISGTPINADVTLDNKAVGQLPLKLNDILVGEHTIVVSKSGYETYTQSVTIADGKTVTINATLTKQVAQTVETTPVSSDSDSTIGGLDMVFVKGGTFTMGATSEQGADAYDDEKPAHSVTLSDFYIGKYEVTQAQWRAVMGSNPSSFKGDNLPVENVSWNDIQKFIQKLNTQTGKEFRLPTEAEWEYAARGGSKSRGYKYSGSNNIGDVAWYSGNSGSKTHPVGQKQPNELGIYDMSGNVWEWCSDWYGSYSSSSQTNPKGPNSGDYRVLRGGDWGMIFWKNIYSRTYANPDRGRMYNGFRLACSSKSNTAKTYYKVGDYYNDGTKEGVVFEVSDNGRSGKIVSMIQSTEKIRWASDDVKYKQIGTNSQNNGVVNMNIVKAIDGWESKYPAFKWCTDLGEGWYLPAKDELDLLSFNTAVHDAVDKTLIAKGGIKLYSKGINTDNYWSSTEWDNSCAYRADFWASLAMVWRDDKQFGHTVRAVAVFGTEITSAPYKVGDYYNDGTKEGVVFEVSADGKHGKIVSMTQSATAMQWTSNEKEQKRLIGADSETDGAANMAKVKARPDWQSKYPAFKWCTDLGDGWYLPAIEEFKKFILDDTIHDVVNRTLAAKGGKKLYNKGERGGWYWSSTERDYRARSGEFCAWLVSMLSGDTNFSSKHYDYYVLAVAKF
ncbi:MAG: SUMF1/EgtB/PvdO family nonheme iron enzyme [Alistipes sp.]|nr:SUMF1/EgtB/PvdO family nonheme iron enzyme [Alistipes sp.]